MTGFLSRLAERARSEAAAAPLLMPKGLGSRFAGTVRRDDSPAEAVGIAPERSVGFGAVRRESPPGSSEPGEIARTEASDEPDEPPSEAIRPLRRAMLARAPAPDEPDALLQVRRTKSQAEPMAGKEEVARLVHRAPLTASPAPQEGVEALPLRRAGPEAALDAGEGGEVSPEGRIGRVESTQPYEAWTFPERPFHADRKLAAPHPHFARETESAALGSPRGETDPAALRPPRPEAVPALAAHGPPERAERTAPERTIARPVAPSGPDFGDLPGWSGAAAHVEAFPGPLADQRGAADSKAERPQVVIDRLDVLIHEPAPTPAAARPVADPGRRLRARYLRGL
jgi:hypothetical protein